MNTSNFSAKAGRRLSPWLQTQLERLLTQRGHAWLLGGPSGLGQFELALALATAWLCERPTAQGACGHCGSCHAVEVHTHADLCMLIPETLSLSLGWPLDEKTQDDLDGKKRKPSKEIKVDAAREAVSFTQFTRSRGTTKVVVVFPAERMNHVTANTLLKTLEEPPGAVKFILATEAAHQLLPTIRSRCLGHTMLWPDFEQALNWLGNETARQGPVDSKPQKAARPTDAADLQTLLRRAGGRPADVLNWVQGNPAAETAQRWQDFPRAMLRGDVAALSDWSPAMAVDALQKLCHDLWAVRVGADPRFFGTKDLAAIPERPSGKTGSPSQELSGTGLHALASWSKDLNAIARTVDHPYNPGLLIESLVSRAKTALSAA
ncbi:MAG: DNA-directed polymerase [Polaromonas sp.]|jgi:DNA polymerase-3 subunit delta'|nr:DNA-directed polymerase [Polaromonas sp.]MDB5938679.1 DNA-directed polymerase [Polaromonas sp.]